MAASNVRDVPNFWSSLVPLKVNILVWRMMVNALPTKVNLQRRGILLTSIECGLCHSREEDLDHCLFRCNKLDPLWRKVWAWCDLSGARTDSVISFKNMLLTHASHRIRNELVHAIIMATVWLIWNRRNRVVHSPQEDANKILQEDLFPAVQILANLWIFYRNPELKGFWQQWAPLPVDS